MINIPFSGNAESTLPLRLCLKRAADATGKSQHEVAIVMSYFFEELSEQVARSRVVRIPGFGVIGVKVHYSRHDTEAAPRVYPAFSAAVPFRNAVSLYCPASDVASDAIDRHRRHTHPSSRKDRQNRMPMTAQQAFRERIKAQARKVGWDL